MQRLLLTLRLGFFSLLLHKLRSGLGRAGHLDRDHGRHLACGAG